MLAMNVDANTPSRDLKPSQELLETIATAKKYAKNALELVKKAYGLAIRDGFNPKEARLFLLAELPFISERTIRKALPEEAKDQSKVRTYFAARVPQNTINVSTEHKVIDVTPEEEEEEEQPTPVEDEEEEEPTELELLKIENMQLKDALKKVQQFQPAGQVETFPLHDEQVFEYLRKRENRINIFYYDNYGIDLIASRLIAQLKNSGVKTFKRLYFEV